MRRIGSLLACLLVVAPAAGAETGPKGAPDPVSLQLGFLFVNYYGADLEKLEQRAAWISEFDLAVALQLVRLSDADLDDIVTWRREGGSWDAITRRCRLGCEIFFVELPVNLELPEPYARPYATWSTRPGADQRLTDEEVRELVILRAMSEHCQLAPEDVVRLRSAGQSPKAIVAVHPPSRRAENAAPPVPAPPPGSAPKPPAKP
ncbi:MAG: hypothetical protein ACE5G2_03635 [Candidatus Krumholzibacteriia bacterium]